MFFMKRTAFVSALVLVMTSSAFAHNEHCQELLEQRNHYLDLIQQKTTEIDNIPKFAFKATEYYYDFLATLEGERDAFEDLLAEIEEEYSELKCEDSDSDDYSILSDQYSSLPYR